MSSLVFAWLILFGVLFFAVWSGLHVNSQTVAPVSLHGRICVQGYGTESLLLLLCFCCCFCCFLHYICYFVQFLDDPSGWFDIWAWGDLADAESRHLHGRIPACWLCEPRPVFVASEILWYTCVLLHFLTCSSCPAFVSLFFSFSGV